jgi:DNA-binding transcriptional LysR family regulator
MVGPPLIVRFVAGVTPGKWERAWRDRQRESLHLGLETQDEALESLRTGAAHMALLRDVQRDDELHAIPLYRELPVVVAHKDSLVAAFESLELADLADETVLTGQDSGVIELVAANVGVAIMPASVARAFSRKEVVARPLTGAPDSGISLVWPVDHAHPLADVFVGIVRGRTANSSR